MSIKTGSIPESKILLAGIESDVNIPGPRTNTYPHVMNKQSTVG